MNQQHLAGTTPMEGVGRNISENNRNLTQKRMKRGECPTCGTKTHKVNFFGKKTALTVEGQSLYGRCLICNPVEGYSRRPPDQPVVPRTLEIEDRQLIDDDAGTMVSGITLDYRLVQGARHWENGMPEDNFDEDTYRDMEEFQRAPKSRPEPSVCEDEADDDWRPTNRRYPDSSFAPPQQRRPPPDRVPARDSRDFPMGRGGSYDREPPRHGRDNLHRKPSRSKMFGASSPPRFAAPMGVIDEKDTETNTSSGGDRKSLSSAERHQSRGSRMNRYTAPPDPYESSSYDRSSRFRSDEEKNEIQPPEEYDDNYDDHHYASNAAEDSRSRQSRAEDSRSRQSRGGRSVSSRSFRTEPKQEIKFDPGDTRDRYVDPKPPQDRFNDIDFSRNSPTPREYVSKPPPAQLKMEPRDELGTSRRSREEARGYGGRPKDDDLGGSEHSDPYSKRRRGRPKDDDPAGPMRRNGRGMPDDDLPDGPVARPATASSRQARGRPETGGPVNKERVNQMFRQLSQPADRHNRDPTRMQVKETATLDEVPTIVSCLSFPEATSLLREHAFEALAEVIWRSGQTAKELVVDNKGIESLVQAMWQDMGSASVQSSAVALLFALAASSDGAAENDVMTEMNAEGAVDALLISMQTHVNVEAVQRSGCCTLCCLAAASSDNRDVNDGTLSGAVVSVVNAMAGQRASLAVQEWGIRALYNQCVYSVNAESNKTSLGKSSFDGGKSVDVIHQAMDIAKSELVTVEWACRLYWCLTSNEEIARTLSSSPKHLNAILKAVGNYRKNPEAGSLTQAAYGALANLAKLEQNHAAVRDPGVVPAVLGSMNFFSNEAGVNVEACALLANLAADPAEKDAIIRSKGIKAVVKTMSFFPDNSDLQEEALRVLVCLCIESDEAKKLASSGEAIKTIVQTLQHQGSLDVQEMAVTVLASLSARRSSVKPIITHGGIHAIAKAMNEHPRERRLQEAACMAWRNVASLEEDVEDLLDEETVGALVRAMDNHGDSEAVQLNGCCVLWNLCAKSQKDPATVEAVGGINSIVKVMQSHMESAAILEMACGALWSILDSSADRKGNAVDGGGIDAVTCALVMHPGEPGCLEKACGVLSSVSVERSHAEAIASAQGISIVVEVMRNNSSNAAVLEVGSLVLRNIVLVNADYTLEATSAISTIINGMKDNPDAIGLQKEACNALWAMAAQSEECKSKILALDGVTVIMNTLDRSAEFEVQEAARGAFNQLAMPSFG